MRAIQKNEKKSLKITDFGGPGGIGSKGGSGRRSQQRQRSASLAVSGACHRDGRRGRGADDDAGLGELREDGCFAER